MAEQNHIILIKNMVCNRCVLVVTEMLKGLHLTPQCGTGQGCRTRGAKTR